MAATVILPVTMSSNGLPANAVPIFVAYAVMSVATMLAYGVDKSRARRGKRRIPENTLHVLALLGGWPGALIAIPLFRHKRRKISFVFVVWLIAAAHVAAWVWWLGGFRAGAAFLSTPATGFGTNRS